MHHPVDWLNVADRNVAIPRIASDFDFWLHGHSHNAWVTPGQTHIVVAAGAVGAASTDEFGVNLVCIHSNSTTGAVHLHNTRAGTNGWSMQQPHMKTWIQSRMVSYGTGVLDLVLMKLFK
jgi:hypothetical protein